VIIRPFVSSFVGYRSYVVSPGLRPEEYPGGHDRIVPIVRVNAGSGRAPGSVFSRYRPSTSP
jgi:hypothetical protein